MSTDVPALWEARVAGLWAALDEHEPAAFVDHIDDLAAELPAGHAVALFERASARDSTGHPDLAVPLYESALHAGLTGIRRRRAVIQMASSLRNLGQPERAIGMLEVELMAADDELNGAVRAFLALALAAVGREHEALAHSLTALAQYLPRYNRSLARYAQSLVAGNAHGEASGSN